jgi:hypothetical protein
MNASSPRTAKASASLAQLESLLQTVLTAISDPGFQARRADSLLFALREEQRRLEGILAEAKGERSLLEPARVLRVQRLNALATALTATACEQLAARMDAFRRMRRSLSSQRGPSSPACDARA